MKRERLEKVMLEIERFKGKAEDLLKRSEEITEPAWWTQDGLIHYSKLASAVRRSSHDLSEELVKLRKGE